MTKAFELTSPDGKKYRVEGPDDATPEQAYDILQNQLKQQNAPTRGGELLRGLAHGAASSVGLSGMVGPEPSGETYWRKTGEIIGGAAPPTIAGFLAPEALGAKALFGAGAGALQPASGIGERIENMGIGAASAFGGGALSKIRQGAKSGLNHLAEMALGYSLGSKAQHPFSAYGGAAIGHFAGRELEKVFGGGLADLAAFVAKNPGLAAYLGIRASPYVEKAGEFVGKELDKPAQ